MALTLIEASKLTQDVLVRGVIETIVSESLVLNYLPFAEIVGQLKAKARPIEELERLNPQAPGTVAAAIARSGRTRESLAWVPVVGRLEIGSAIVDTARGEVVAVLPISPF